MQAQKSMEELIDTNPVAVYKALKDMIEPQNKKSPFIPCKQTMAPDYSFADQTAETNVARHIRRE